MCDQLRELGVGFKKRHLSRDGSQHRDARGSSGSFCQSASSSKKTCLLGPCFEDVSFP